MARGSGMPLRRKRIRYASIPTIKAAESKLNATYNDFPTGLEFLAKDDGSVTLTHVIQVKNDHWMEAFIDAQTGDVVGMVDFTAESGVRMPYFSSHELLYLIQRLSFSLYPSENKALWMDSVF